MKLYIIYANKYRSFIDEFDNYEHAHHKLLSLCDDPSFVVKGIIQGIKMTYVIDPDGEGVKISKPDSHVSVAPPLVEFDGSGVA